MSNQEKVRALYSVITGCRYEEHAFSPLSQQDIWKGAALLVQFFAPTEAQLGTLLLHIFGGVPPWFSWLPLSLVGIRSGAAISWLAKSRSRAVDRSTVK